MLVHASATLHWLQNWTMNWKIALGTEKYAKGKKKGLGSLCVVRCFIQAGVKLVVRYDGLCCLQIFDNLWSSKRACQHVGCLSGSWNGSDRNLDWIRSYTTKKCKSSVFSSGGHNAPYSKYRPEFKCYYGTMESCSETVCSKGVHSIHSSFQRGFADHKMSYNLQLCLDKQQSWLAWPLSLYQKNINKCFFLQWG